MPLLGHWLEKKWHILFLGRWSRAEHNNVLELRTAVRAAKVLGRDASSWDRRALLISGSQAAVGALAKGRSSRRVFNLLCRRQASLALGLGLRFYWRYVRTHRNVADGPSRGYGLGVAPKEPAVLAVLEEGQDDSMPEEFRRIAG